ncbi:hypothetical protein CTRI78_v007788 [Colletotrichum trifolii]|uniref:Uncharacterized protein n=1 Tax=Colletotrichum trifolii TaxID=5466 RepID=A0A4R8R108_COLTR|nr:hypothetical protein CTRI78_v007788 [Colletotrichum trifolii]
MKISPRLCGPPPLLMPKPSPRTVDNSQGRPGDTSSRFPTALPSYCMVGAAFRVEHVLDKLAMDNGPARAPSRPHRAPRVYS